MIKSDASRLRELREAVHQVLSQDDVVPMTPAGQRLSELMYGDDAAEQPHDVIQAHVSDAVVPATKTVTLSLTYYSNSYKVTACNNTAAYKPGDWLSPQAVGEICALPNWQVIITDNDLQSQVLGFIKGMIPTITL